MANLPTMARKHVCVKLNSICTYDFDYLDQLEYAIKKKLDSVDEEFRKLVKFAFDDGTTTIDVYYHRPETDEEMNARYIATSKTAEAIKLREIQQLKELIKKHGIPE